MGKTERSKNAYFRFIFLSLAVFRTTLKLELLLVIRLAEASTPQAPNIFAR
jgi:hypothetical protein